MSWPMWLLKWALIWIATIGVIVVLFDGAYRYKRNNNGNDNSNDGHEEGDHEHD